MCGKVLMPFMLPKHVKGLQISGLEIILIGPVRTLNYQTYSTIKIKLLPKI